MRYRICRSSRGVYKVQYRLLGLWLDRREIQHVAGGETSYLVKCYWSLDEAKKALHRLQNPPEKTEPETWEVV